jgi:C-terminal processing protease CtpA/Prc
VLIERVASDGPSARSGLQIGDELLAIDNVPVSSMTEQDLRQRLPGDVGSTVRLRVRRDGSEREFVVERAPYRDGR